MQNYYTLIEKQIFVPQETPSNSFHSYALRRIFVNSPFRALFVRDSLALARVTAQLESTLKSRLPAEYARETRT